MMIPGRPYSFVAALESGRSSWTAVLDAVRLGPDDDETEVTQIRQAITRLIAAGHWRAGDPDILIVFDAGYDVTRLAWQLAGLPVEMAGRLRSDRVLYFPAPPRAGGSWVLNPEVLRTWVRQAEIDGCAGSSADSPGGMCFRRRALQHASMGVVLAVAAGQPVPDAPIRRRYSA